MRPRLTTYTPDIDREALTLYGGLFLVVLFGYGVSTEFVFGGVFGDGMSLDLGIWFFGGLMFGLVPAILSLLFLKIHRYAYPSDA